VTEPTDEPVPPRDYADQEVAPQPELAGATEAVASSGASSAQLVAIGILLSRIAGLVRNRVFAHYFGATLYADVFTVALRMPNALQNLLGEGTLSASFIPVYSRLLQQGRHREAGRVAGAVFALLLVVAAVIALIGIALAPVLVSVFTPGFEGDRRELSIIAVRIIFPMTGVLVLFAWSLGILNSHRRFFLPYFAPVLWNVVIIATLLFFGMRMELPELTIALAWGALAGGVVQFAVLLPSVLRLERELHIRWDLELEGVRTTVRNAGPAIAGRGVVQLSGYLDMFLASFLISGAVASLGYAQLLYMLPVSLFGMSVAAAELPELSRQADGGIDALRERINRGLRQMAVFVVPTAVGYIVIGDVVVGAIYRTGEFGANETLFVHLVLAGYALGLIASTATRLFSSAFFAMHDTRTPARIAMLRVLLAGTFGAALMFALRNTLVGGNSLGAVGLTVAAGVAAWVEWALLRRRLRARIGDVGAGGRTMGRLLAAALIAVAAAFGIKLLLVPDMHPALVGVTVLAAYGIVYFALAIAFGVEAARANVGRVLRRFR
jgi:putative peptidoglycan lipid II flippase